MFHDETKYCVFLTVHRFIDEMKLKVMRGDRLQEALLKWFPWDPTAVQHHLLIAIVGNAPVVFLIMDMLLAAHSSWCQYVPIFLEKLPVFLRESNLAMNIDRSQKGK